MWASRPVQSSPLPRACRYPLFTSVRRTTRSFIRVAPSVAPIGRSPSRPGPGHHHRAFARRRDSALSCPGPSPEPDSCRTIRQTGSVKGRRSRSRVTPQAPLTGSGCREHSYGGFGGGHPHFHLHNADLRITRVFQCVARGLKDRASFMFVGCCWRRSLAADGGSGASRGHAPVMRRLGPRWCRRHRSHRQRSERTCAHGSG